MGAKLDFEDTVVLKEAKDIAMRTQGQRVKRRHVRVRKAVQEDK
mgnify:CR=1 FL=1